MKTLILSLMVVAGFAALGKAAASSRIFSVLKKMTANRQIEVATLMNDSDIYTEPYAKALLAATPKNQLANPEKPKKIKGLSEEQMARMEAEMSSLQNEYTLIEEG